MAHRKFAQTLKNINIMNFVDASYIISMDDYAFFSKFQQQKGGSIEKNYDVKYNHNDNSYIFKIYQTTETDRISFSVYNGNNVNNTQCVTIFYDIEGKFCYLASLSVYDKCYIGMIYSNKGTLLLKFSIDFIENYIAKKYKVKYIQLRDTSMKLCKMINKSIDLDSMYMFMYGETWYGKYGFMPFDESHKSTNKPRLTDYEKNREIVKKTLIKNVKLYDIFANAVKSVNGKINDEVFSIKKIEMLLKKYEDYTVAEFMKEFLKSYDKSCAIFYYMFKDLIIELKMTDLHGISYWKKL